MPTLSSTQSLAAGLVGVIFILWARSKQQKRSRLPLPPGPPALPIIGNMLDMPKDKPWLTYDKMAKQYGDIFHMNVLGQHMIFLSSTKRTNEIFEKRSAIYSDRVRLIMLNELIGWNFSFAFQHYGDEWRTHRRLFYEHFNAASSQKYRPAQLHEAHAFLRRLLETPDNFLHHIRHTFSAVIMSIAYGIQVKGTEDPYISTAQIVMDSLAKAGVAGSFFVDLIPALRYVPAWTGVSFKKKAAYWNSVINTMLERPFEAVKRAMKEGVATPSVASQMLEDMSEETDPERRREAEDLAKKCVANMYAGGADTTVSTVQSFMLAMAMYPEVQKRAHEELDRVIGQGRLPDFNDHDSLPYIRAMVKETMRWQLVLPMAVPHASIQDDEYDGYFIPKGSVVIGLAWTILHDPEVYPEPEEYKPERFLTKDGKLDLSVQDATIAAFGYGRRICPGQHMSDNALFINIASVLAVYSITPPLDDAGKPIQLSPGMSSGMLSYPTPFKCGITPRSEAALKLIKESELY